MVSRSDFARHLATLDLSHVDRAVAFLYYYRETQKYEERSASDLAGDLHDEGFPKPNVTYLRLDLSKSRFTIIGSKPELFQLDIRRIEELEKLYGQLLKRRKVSVSNNLIPSEWVAGTRQYLEQMAYQINATYEYGMYDACAVLLRRLMESLIIEIYISQKRHHDIQVGGVFLMLDKLISKIMTDKGISLSRNTPKTMWEIKQLGDTAAHDRTYITPQVDIDDLKARYRRLIQELLFKAGITK
jgi:hypothetical protein